MLIKKPADIPSSEITPESLYQDRRAFIGTTIGAVAAAALTACKSGPDVQAAAPVQLARMDPAVKSPFSTSEKPNTYKDITTYNNFYEFGTDKSDPAANAHTLVTRPWKIAVAGEVNKPRTFDIDEILKMAPLEERIYRHRCVEGWSMVIPWIGFSLSELIKRVEPKSTAKFVQFVTLKDPKMMPGQRSWTLQWPYREGLRMDEAMHPLTLLAFGLYNSVLPNQNGAPLRLAVPWKYGFKSIKSIVALNFVRDQPQTSWNIANPSEYGFYSNVNPQVDHPRWSQANERRIGKLSRQPTLMFNGYGDQVARLYNGMDLKKNF